MKYWIESVIHSRDSVYQDILLLQANCQISIWNYNFCLGIGKQFIICSEIRKDIRDNLVIWMEIYIMLISSVEIKNK